MAIKHVQTFWKISKLWISKEVAVPKILLRPKTINQKVIKLLCLSDLRCIMLVKSTYCFRWTLILKQLLEDKENTNTNVFFSMLKHPLPKVTMLSCLGFRQSKTLLLGITQANLEVLYLNKYSAHHREVMSEISSEVHLRTESEFSWSLYHNPFYSRLLEKKTFTSICNDVAARISFWIKRIASHSTEHY